MLLSDLFYNCAYKVQYKTVGNDVNYAFSEAGDKLWVYFQGSSSLVDWYRNFLFTEKLYKLFRVHRGFYDAYSEVRNILLDKVMKTDKDGKFKYNHITIIGYSHGGALCQIAFEDVKYHRPNADIEGYAFESPRCLKVPKKYRFLWDGLYVIRNNNDLITHLPPRLFGYHHLGEMIKISGDTSIVMKRLPKCIKSHYPECVLEGLHKYQGT